MSREEFSGHSAFCNLCEPALKMPVEAIVEHLWEAHGERVEFETWPDGEVVVHDTTLEPGDFAGESG